MADLGYFTSYGEKITKSESEKRFGSKKKSSSTSSTSSKSTFENAPPGYVLNPDGTIRKEGTFRSDQTVTQTVQAVQAPPTRSIPTVDTVKTLATPENIARAEADIQAFQREEISRARSRRVEAEIKGVVEAEVAKGVNIKPSTVGATKPVSVRTPKTTINVPREFYSSPQPAITKTKAKVSSFNVISEDINPPSEFTKTKESIKEKLFSKSDEPLSVKEIIYSPLVLASGIGKTAADVGEGFIVGGVYQTVKALTWEVDKTIGSIVTTGASLITGEKTVKGIAQSSWLSAGDSIIRRPGYFAGQTLFGVAGGKVIGTTVGKVKTGYVKVGATKIDPKTIFSEDVLIGKKKVPTVKSTSESLKLFDEASGIVQTSSPSKISGTVAGAGRKGAVGLEDPGIYVTPAGKGSPAFLRIAGSEYTILPSSVVPKFGSWFDVPTVTRFKTTGVDLIPGTVVSTPGFTAVKEFFESQTGSGKAFITKRSQIGQGDLPPQKFIAPDDFIEGDFNIKKGDVRLEGGTSELEAVVPIASEFAPAPQKSFLGKLKGFSKYTEYKDEVVAIRDVDLITSPVLAGSSVSSTAGKLISGSRIAKESSLVYNPVSGVYGSIIKPQVLFSVVSSPSSKISGSVVSLPGTVVSSPQISKTVSSPVSSVPVSLPVSRFDVVGSSVPVLSSSVSVPKTTTSRGSRSRVSSPVSSVPVSLPVTSSVPVSSPRGRSSALSPKVSSRPFIPSPVSYFKGSSPTDRQGNLFFGQVRKAGRFVTVASGTAGLVAREAGKLVETTPLASARVVSARTGEVQGGRGLFSSVFRRSKRDQGVFVEKNIYRIDTAGEIGGISRKGGKKKRRGVFEWLA